MSEEKNIHAGHRSRLRRQFLQGGLDCMSEVNVLELLLFYALPRRDTNALAHRLLEAFGSLPGVLDATVEELCGAGGLSENAAVLLKLTAGLSRKSQLSRQSTGDVLNTTDKLGRWVLPLFEGATSEAVYILALDTRCKLLGCRKLTDGSLNAASLRIRDVVEYAIRLKACSIVMAHNHPSGIALPSQEDVVTTRRVAAALNAVDVLLADHLIVGDDDFVSLLQSNLMPSQVES